MEVLSQNGWELYALTVFLEQLQQLVTDVETVAKKRPEKLNCHPKYKLLIAVTTAIYEQVPENPQDTKYLLGKTLGPTNKAWRRVKAGLPSRYRLFFQFRSSQPKAIVYAWFNNDKTQRKAGSKTDVYESFKVLMQTGQVPRTWDELIGKAKPLSEETGEAS
ncbi:type II toxin-antitoxin system YhaV family toxin [Sansalvadorimonas verongulae]|uniref:type II toxin-antitoxin system YhaV family toxin n=1 Tax=Sansalvadorimonas verongulae TaxID=2172824 RepID=UPI0012BB5A40|nr:type II toxin-antitoxin system YhaV family toxin [Sansalvadorimonas verongulae]MTI12785.1 hypothetical protein [Sansalvadorimonas verongulae]